MKGKDVRFCILPFKTFHLQKDGKKLKDLQTLFSKLMFSLQKHENRKTKGDHFIHNQFTLKMINLVTYHLSLKNSKLLTTIV